MKVISQLLFLAISMVHVFGSANFNSENEQTSQNSPKDTRITQQIRQELMKDASLSTYAKNIQINSENGRVVVRGPVKSRQEESIILQKARAIAGKAQVTNELSIVTVSK